MTRAAWKVFYRDLRISRREASKVWLDAAIYGVGFVFASGDGPPQHISVAEVYR